MSNRVAGTEKVNGGSLEDAVCPQSRYTCDPLEYNYFIETLKDLVESAISNPKQKLIRVLNYTLTGKQRN